ncbi:potassium channel family protein [Anoxybacillus sp. J5B_2022]|uniref:potassium channel family protein n=1 Tax=Anoxybacillus sp. J5B_2022 TaxID=3003246 RepID=UPI002286A7DA|nr:potassium channel protein [Anoxybacillus sp. J5B_2022]MCZ0756303.1 potassium channel protein [Anoxybacillus sp. J5B_2022]
MKYAYFRLPLVARMLLIGGLMIVVFGWVIHVIEPNTYRSFFDGVWWAIVTAATVGYGDFVPKTLTGKLVAISLILVGTSFLSAYFAALSASAVSKENTLLEGELPYTKEGHIVIVGWNERTRELLRQLTERQPLASFVIIDETLTKLPIANKNIHFIKGNPTYDSVLQKANIAKAKMAVITADPHKHETEADMSSILTLVAMKGLHPTLYTIVEILTAQQAANAKRAGADEMIQTNALASFSFIHTIQSPGFSTMFEQFLHSSQESYLQIVEVPDEMIGRTFRESCQALIEDRVLPIGIVRGEASLLNPSPDFVLMPHDRLFVVKR